MKIVKKCLYRATNYNLLPTVLLTPLYSVNKYCPPFSTSDAKCFPRADWTWYADVPKAHWTKAGFRLAFKFICLHAGIEVHYGS